MKRRSVTIITIAVLLGSALVFTGLYAPASTMPVATSSSIFTTSIFTSIPSQSATSTGSSSFSSPPSGALAIMITDPTFTSGGVSAVYMSYDNVAIHPIGSDADQGWIQLNSSGSIDLARAVNQTETVASTNVQVGSYDTLRFDVTSAQANYRGANYTASVLTSRVNARLIGALGVNSSLPSAALIEVSLFVYLTGTVSRPSFTVSASALAFAVPQSEVTTDTLLIGSRMSLQGAAWWSLDLKTYQPRIEIKSATLSSGSLNIALSNVGGGDSRVLAVIISQTAEGTNANARLPDINGTAIFTIRENGSLHSVDATADALAAIREIVSAPGTQLSPKSPLTLNFSSSISFGVGLVSKPPVIVPGDQYRITVVDETGTADIVVAAT